MDKQGTPEDNSENYNHDAELKGTLLSMYVGMILEHPNTPIEHFKSCLGKILYQEKSFWE
ncbi:MAG: hypothetical protein M1165_00960 [Candidatus Pacearchaeota archaeon]|nr:hypothetical protein [Candidatus Pacearchaeota archaeon]MDE1849005.1 hypothetical protein [Nanoarchaeota archaeon]